MSVCNSKAKPAGRKRADGSKMFQYGFYVGCGGAAGLALLAVGNYIAGIVFLTIAFIGAWYADMEVEG